MPPQDARTLSDLLASGSFPYALFLDLADQLARQVEALHAQQLAHGQISAHLINISQESRLTLRVPETYIEATPVAIREDLYQVGLVFAQMLSEARETSPDMPIHPIISDNLPLDAATYLIPVESRLLLEELLAEDAAHRIKSASELVSTIGELQRLHQMPLEPSVSQGRDNARLYFFFAMFALLLLAVWVILSLFWRR
jgi:hypothetical protein